VVPVGFPLPLGRTVITELRAALKPFLQVQGIEYSIFMEACNTGFQINLGPQEMLAVPGLRPLPVTLFVFSHAALGELDLSMCVTYLPQDQTGGTGPIEQGPFGRFYTLRELCKHALVEQDATALRMLERTIGSEQVQAWIRTLREESAGSSQLLSDYAACFRRLLALVDERPSYGGELMQWIRQGSPMFGLAKYFTACTPVAHIVGRSPTCVGDMGLLFRQGEPYLLCLSATTPIDQPVGPVLESMAQIGHLVYQQMGRLAGKFASIALNGKRIPLETPACLLHDGTVVIPLQAFVAGVGARARLDPCTNNYLVEGYGHSGVISAAQTFSFDQQTYVPSQIVAACLGLTADWDGNRNRLLLTQ
jgi:hypothetical protein